MEVSVALVRKKMELFRQRVTNCACTALFPEKTMSPAIQFEADPGCTAAPACPKTWLGLEQPGAFQCAILRAFELPKGYRDVFLLKEIQGHTSRRSRPFSESASTRRWHA